MADGADPVAFVQRANNIGADGHAADFFDLAAGDGLTVGDQRQRLKQCPRILLGTLLPEPPNPGAELFAHLKTKSTRHLDQFKTAPLATFAHLLEGAANIVVAGTLMLFEQGTELRHRQGLARGEQRRFKNLYQSDGVTHSARPLT